MVWPKSGSITRSDTSINKQHQRHRGRRHFRPLASIPQTATPPAPRRRVWRNSEAWMLTPISVIQRREPLTSGPINSVATISAIETANTISAVRRIWRGDMKDTPISTMKDGSRNSTWRLKKWNGSSPILVATGGLAASERMMPASISAMIAPSMQLVDGPPPLAQSGLRCSRESMGGSQQAGVCPLVAHDGCQGLMNWTCFEVRNAVAPQ